MVADPRFMLDSNICIYLLEGLSEQARRRIEQCSPGEVVTSAIAYAEVLRGLPIDASEGRRSVDRFFDTVKVRPFDETAAAAYRLVPFRRGQFDRLIAAHAFSLGLTLVTNNQDDFADVSGLRIENWTL